MYRRIYRWLGGTLALGCLSVLAWSSLVAVDEAEYAVVTSFGQVVAVHGARAGHVGATFQASLAVGRAS